MENNNHFSKYSITVLKGIAMMFIVFHNFLIFQPNSKFYNEEKFSSHNVIQFLDHLWPVQWHESFSAIAIFFGHYGVQIFIFCTVYGLSQLYKSDNFTSYYSHLKTRFTKLLLLLGLGILIFILCYYLESKRIYPLSLFLKNALLLLTTAGNFSKTTLYSMFTGPFWYFGLTFQLLLILPYLFKIITKHGLTLCLLTTYALIYPLYYIDQHSTFSVFGNIIGHIPEVFIGIYLSIHGISKIKWYHASIAAVLFPFTQIYAFLFPLSFASMLIAMLFLYSKIYKRIPELMKSNLFYIGTISMILFVTNGYFRFLSFFNPSDSVLRAERVFLYFIFLLVTSHILHKVYIYLLNKLKLK